jgi:hypothetical protein
MKNWIILVSCLAACLSANQAIGQESAPPAGAGCGPALVISNPAERAKVEAQTRAVALAFVKGSVEEQDKLLAPNALFWALGFGYLDRSQYVALHKPKSGVVRGAPTSHKQTIYHVVVDGDVADIDMENYVVWPDFTYNQQYNNLFQVRDGKICLAKLFSNPDMAKAMLPDVKNYIKK